LKQSFLPNSLYVKVRKQDRIRTCGRRCVEGVSMKIKADNSLCSGHARCAAMAPDIFTLDSDGYVGFSEKEIMADQLSLALRGVRACPERALSLIGDDGATLT
jgi:ferredoxin